MASQDNPVVCSLVREHARAAFRFLNEDEVERLCPYLALRQVPAETVLMREGEGGNLMGFLLRGKLAVKKETSFAGKHILLAILEPGTMVGEVSVVARSPRNATVVAMEESTLLELTDAGFERFLELNPALGVRLLRHIVHVVSLRLRNADDRLALLL
ncbi:MAG: cyclic nucleotide-binding domain-containing protein [Desulfobulbaceae bacterium]|nr:cyclic nucleotide-binding domain-containing protein [Desulfobulbaceae bacterium]